MHVKKIVFVVSCLIMSTALMPAANAGTATGKLTIRANVGEVCRVSSGDDALIDFGNLSQFTTINSAQTDSTHGIKVLCSKDRAYKIGLDGGQNPLGTSNWNSRRMKSGENFITYSLYKEAAKSNYWGPVASGYAQSAVGTGVDQVFPVYARTEVQNMANSGDYSDVVTIELEY